MNGKSDIQNKSTKEKITLTALELFADQGYHKTSVSQIAAKVGISKSLIYNYFDSKDHLLSAIVDSFIQRGIEKLPNGSIENMESLDDLMDYLRALMHEVKSHPSYYRLMIMLTLQGKVKELIMTNILEKQANLIPQLNAFFNKFHPENAEMVTYLFGAFMDGIVLHYLYMEGNYPIEDVFDFFTSKLHRLIKP